MVNNAFQLFLQMVNISLLLAIGINQVAVGMEGRWPEVLGLSSEANEQEITEGYYNRRIISIVCSADLQAKQRAEFILQRALEQGIKDKKDPIQGLNQELIHEKQIISFSRLKVQLDNAKSSFRVVRALSTFFQSSMEEQKRLRFGSDQELFKQKLVHNFYPFVTTILHKASDMSALSEIQYHEIQRSIKDIASLNAGIDCYFDKECLTVWELKKCLCDLLHKSSRAIIQSSLDLKKICAGYHFLIESMLHRNDEKVIKAWLMEEYRDINLQKRANRKVSLRIKALNEILNTYLLPKINSIDCLPFDICPEELLGDSLEKNSYPPTSQN